MTRFKKELITRGVLLEETVPLIVIGNNKISNYTKESELTLIEVIEAETATVYYYDNRIGKYWVHYGRHMHVVSVTYEED